jgi:hypothetical protein
MKRLLATTDPAGTRMSPTASHVSDSARPFGVCLHTLIGISKLRRSRSRLAMLFSDAGTLAGLNGENVPVRLPSYRRTADQPPKCIGSDLGTKAREQGLTLSSVYPFGVRRVHAIE